MASASDWPPREEDASGDSGGHAATETGERLLRDLFRSHAQFGVFAGKHHVWFEQRAFQMHALIDERFEEAVECRFGDREAALDVVRSVHQYFRFDNGHQAGFLR